MSWDARKGNGRSRYLSTPQLLPGACLPVCCLTTWSGGKGRKDRGGGREMVEKVNGKNVYLVRIRTDIGSSVRKMCLLGCLRKVDFRKVTPGN